MQLLLNQDFSIHKKFYLKLIPYPITHSDWNYVNLDKGILGQLVECDFFKKGRKIFFSIHNLCFIAIN